MFNSSRELTLSTSRNIKFIFAFVFVFAISSFTQAQCAMCRASLASQENKSKAEAVNDGIVYLMIIPYILAALLGYTIYRMKKK